MAAISYLNLFARDIEALCRFYRDVFGFAAVDAVASPIFRAVDAGTCRIGFNAHDAYRLLGDGVAAPVVRFLSEHLLLPLVAAPSEAARPILLPA